MKFSYDKIKENLRIYNEAKERLPIISDFETGKVSINIMRNVGLDKFADFYQFQKNIQDKNFTFIQALNYQEIKEIIINQTSSERFKTLIKNKSLKSFKKLIEEDSQTFDRLLNGRWLTKPGYSNRGRRLYGRRSNECVEGFDKAFIPLLNWIISNDIDVCENKKVDIFKSFIEQDKYTSRIKWYTGIHLSLDNVPLKEIEITHNLLKSLIDFVEGSKIDFRKLNSDFIIESFQNKVKNLMIPENGTFIRSKFDFKSSAGSDRLTSGKDYIIESSNIQSGFLRVLIIDDSGYRNWYDYREFEDKSIERDLLLNQLGII